MNRRAAVPAPLIFMVRLFLTLLIVVSATALNPSVGAAIEPVDEAPPTTEPSVPNTRPPISANDFIPDDRDLTDCIGVLERPGCGSEARGGWRQFAILGAITLGLLVVFGNVVRGVRRNRR